MAMNLKSYNQLISQAASYMLEKMNLSPTTVYEYKLAWHHLRDYMAEHHIVDISRNVSDKYFLEKFGSNNYVELKMVGQRKAFKAINRLIEYKLTQQMNFVYPNNNQINYVFEGKIGLYINTFIATLKSENISSLSINKYERYLSIFNNFLIKYNITTVQQLTSSLLLTYIQSFDKNEPPYRIIHSLAIVTRFCKFLYKTGVISIDISKRIPRYKKVNQPQIPSVYSKEEIVQLLSSIDRQTRLGKRNYAIILLAARLGLRLSDIRNLKFENIQWEDNRIAITQYKTGKGLALPLLTDVGNAIYDYIKYGRQISDSQYVFIPERSGRDKLLISSIYTIFLKAFIKSGIKTADRKRGPHSLRHSLGYELLQQSTPLPYVSEVLGHRNTESTKYYMRIDLTSMRKCVIDVPGVNNQFYEQKGGCFYE